MLSSSQERAVSWSVWNGASMKEVELISNDLRASSQHFQDKSVQQLAKVVDDFSHLKVIEATKGIDTMVDYQLEAAQRTAQANRLENEARRIIQEQAKPIPTPLPDLKAMIPQNTKHTHFNHHFVHTPGSGWC
jgi:hypothetical protein